MSNINTEYVDLNLSFARHPVTKDVSKVVGVNAVKQSIQEIIITAKMDWQVSNEFGVGARKYLGENANSAMLESLKSVIQQQIETYETRAEIDTLTVEQNSDEKHAVIVTLKFYVRNNAERATLSVPLQLLR